MKRIAIALLLVSLPAAAADKAADVVKYRQSVMKAMGAHMTALSLVVNKHVSDRSQGVGHAEALHAMSVGLLAFFPRGTGPDKVRTDAKPEIWSRSTEFIAAVAAYERESAKLADAAKRGDTAATDAALQRVGEGCTSCHRTFRHEE